MSIINEAFKHLSKLNEETFDIDDFKGIDEFTKKDLKDPLSVTVIDPDAESDDQVENSYIGNVILDCCICHSKLYRDPSEVVISETEDVVNDGEECPYCYSTYGYKVIGQVAPYEKEEVKVEVEAKKNESLTEATRNELPKAIRPYSDRIITGEFNWAPYDFDDWDNKNAIINRLKKQFKNCDVEVVDLHGPGGGYPVVRVTGAVKYYWPGLIEYTGGNIEEAIYQLIGDYKDPKDLDDADLDEFKSTFVESLTEAKRKSFKSLDSIDAEMDDRKEKARKRFLRAKDDARSDRDYRVRRNLRQEAIDLSKKPGTMSYVLEKNMDKVWGAKSKDSLIGIIKKLFDDNGINTEASNRLLFNIDRQRDLTRAQQVVANSILAGSGLKSESIKENLEKVEIETETDKIKVESEPRDASKEETVAPLTDTVEQEIEANSSEDEDSTIDFDVDEVQEESFNKLAEGYLKKVYENVRSYKTTSVLNKGNKLVFEGLIKFASGNSKKTSFIFESSTATKDGKVKFFGENKQITRGKKSFMLEGKVNKNSLLTESLRYNYRIKDSEGKSQRVYGRISK